MSAFRLTLPHKPNSYSELRFKCTDYLFTKQIKNKNK